jgi:hypothetical protein
VLEAAAPAALHLQGQPLLPILVSSRLANIGAWLSWCLGTKMASFVDWLNM